MPKQTAGETLAYIGTYTRGKSEGIYVYRLDTTSGALSHVSTAKGIQNPSFLDIHPSQRYLYSVCEVEEFNGKRSGAVTAFSIEPSSGALTKLNHQLSGGRGPCHVSVDKTGKFVLVANYGSGSASVLPIKRDGSLGEATHTVQHQGSSIDPKRQEGPHAHCIVLSPDNHFAFVADLGLDKVMIYRLGLKNGRLTPNDTPWVKVKPGAGPRHFTIHPSLKYAYIINELDSTLTASSYDAERGLLNVTEALSTLPQGFTGTNYCADVHVHPSGKFVYGSNRGHDSIVIFSINTRNGKLTLVGHEPTQGKTPRNFAIDPRGTFLFAENQDSDTIVTFRIDQRTGKLAPTGHVAQVPMPVCLRFLTR
jgi:6-phosphogluconolactonase